MLVKYQDRKYLQSATSHKSPCEASRRAECGKSARSVRRGGEWNPATVRLVRHSQRKRGATDRPDLRVWRHSSTLPSHPVVRNNGVPCPCSSFRPELIDVTVSGTYSICLAQFCF